MSFTRTTGGLSAQNHFYGADYIVYIEGKNQSGSDKTYDEKYYNSLLSLFLKNKNTTIKVVGSCTDVIKIHEKITKGNIKNTICFIDRDYSGTKFSYLPDYRLIESYGYSWENDFWSMTLCEFVVKSFTDGKVTASKELTSKTHCGIKRLSFLHRVNVASSFFDENIFTLGGKGNNNGIVYDSRSPYLVSKNEMTRMLLPLRKSQNINEMISIFRRITCDPQRLIQGHYLEYILLRTMRDIIKKHSHGNSTAPETTLKNTSFFHFMQKPSKYLSTEVKDYYQLKLSLF
ncbi:DUF4435 domain-containing protein [Serratia marcescens]|uniref:DUF4435 domain-containing protein n=1 Tax=Serratia marcescens TaxID=615 RepID=UPI001009345F|nr:DUF4435 domain-containing protein [Serratia marcescens]RXG77743.1 DUF4435 domain-containing protein [Serratia marcescens]RXG79941.1 DUF4435 domain-containing protein [Serratia marcescens]